MKLSALLSSTLAVATLTLGAAAPSQAAFIQMFERDQDTDTNEIGFRGYNNFQNVVDNVTNGPDAFSDINVSSLYSSSGLTWDGNQFIQMFERDEDTDTNEIGFRTYDSLLDVINNITNAPDVFSDINVSSLYSSSGLTWDGSQFIQMFERVLDTDTNEIGFRTYATFQDMIDNITSGPDLFSDINVSSLYTSSGLTWDGNQFIQMFERDEDTDVNEIGFRTYDSFQDMVDNITNGPDSFSDINVSSLYSSSGLAFVPEDQPPNDIPLPSTLWLMFAGLSGTLLVRQRKSGMPA